ncbi:MAG: LPS export ABC transporter periplasmic protein LptC [Candidatus Mcinerneyibacterium aminivorans]|jgi:LPS export ABC transporter protein LptC|uniref:LPS export ABC transporter periplasmic protein LptC n=1 Tax=Candidatus Mcinerneyibacterium aminivorans TaxID=2703815 RepID=A0A5D0M9H5_9BACT|nr:MAG: LPS export ABC transporter periplasmic protein LptC [Candidatus Mcinerneyibacterium aminivorans]
MKRILFIFAMIVLLVPSCKKEAEQKQEAPEPGQLFEKGMEIQATKQGRLEWKMQVKTLTQKEEEVKKVHGEDVKLFLYDSEEKLMVEVVSEEGTANLTTNNVVLNGNVRLVNKQNKTKLYTDILNYNSEKEQIYTESTVKIVKENSEINGKGMVADLAMNEIVIKETYGKK